MLDYFTAMLVMVLPGDRLSYYQTSNIAEMRSSIFGFTNGLVDELGYFPAVG